MGWHRCFFDSVLRHSTQRPRSNSSILELYVSHTPYSTRAISILCRISTGLRRLYLALRVYKSHRTIVAPITLYVLLHLCCLGIFTSGNFSCVDCATTCQKRPPALCWAWILFLGSLFATTEVASINLQHPRMTENSIIINC